MVQVWHHLSADLGGESLYIILVDTQMTNQISHCGKSRTKQCGEMPIAMSQDAV